MAFPAETITTQKAWDNIRATAKIVKDQGASLSAATSAGPVVRTDILKYAEQLYDYRQKWTTWAAVSGLQAYARDQLDDQTFVFATEYGAMETAADSMLVWLDANLPTGGYADRQTDFTMQPNTFSTAQTAGFRTEVAALNATIA